MTSEYVYLMAADGLPVVKIGKAVDPERRMRVLQTGTPVRLSLLWTTPGGLDLEKRLHRKFLAYRKHGEWFDLTPLGDPVTVVRRAVRNEPVDTTPPAQYPAAPVKADDAWFNEWSSNGRFGLPRTAPSLDR